MQSKGCAATDGGRLVPTSGGGNPDLDNAARNAGSLGDRPLVVLTAGEYWAPAGLEKEAADYHEVWVDHLQASLAQLSTRGRQVVVDAHHASSIANYSTEKASSTLPGRSSPNTP